MIDTTASRCLDMVARHAPRLMREGGGMIEEDRKTNKLSRKTINSIIALRKTGMRIDSIGERLGVSRSAVQVHCKRYKLAENASHKQPSVS
jgi:DNA invertase Pin-like site-specific DNA recombinase